MGTATVEARTSGSSETTRWDPQPIALRLTIRKSATSSCAGTPENSQQLRFAVQAVFFTLNIWIGFQFYLWVRWAETGGQTPALSRPAGVEGWLPIEGLMQFKYVLLSGHLPRLHPAAFFLFTVFALSSLLLRKSFCGWLCPVGTVSEYLWKYGRRVFGRNFRLPRWLDLPLRSLKFCFWRFSSMR